MRGLVIATVTVVVVAGCGQATQGGPTIDYRLYEAASTQTSPIVAIIDARTHTAQRRLPLGTPSPDWRHYYTVSSNRLLDIDPQTGATQAELALARPYQLAPATVGGVPGGLSQDGRWLVLETAAAASTPRSESHLLVVNTSSANPPTTVDLAGDFRFDAISNDGRRLYLINHTSAAQYFVRFFDLTLGRLDPTVIFDKSDGGAAMSGLRLSGVGSPDGHWLYSVYARKDKSAFIHALSLDGPLAFCIDLPGTGYASDPSQLLWSVALSGDGSRLFAANGALGVVAEVDNANGYPTLRRTVRVASNNAVAGGVFQNVAVQELGAAGAALSPDGRTLVMVGQAGIEWIDTALMVVTRTGLPTWRVSSIALSPDAKTLYAVNQAGAIAEVSMGGGEVIATFDPSIGQPMGLMRVEAAA